MIARNYKYNNLTIRVGTSEPSHHTWLEEFFCPHFEIMAEGNWDTQVTLLEDTSQYEEMLSQGTQGDEEVDCFVMDSKVIRLPRWHSPNRDLVLFEEKFNVFYLVNQEKAEICLLTPDGNRRARMPLLRVIRELAMNESMHSGGLFVHGAAFAVGNKGVIIAGPKGAGKTTLLLHAFRHEATNYLSSDRVLVSFTDTGAIFRGMPTIPSILPSTLEIFPHFRESLLSSCFHYWLTMAEAQELAIPAQPGQIGKFGVTPAQFCNLLKLSPVAEAQGWALVFPQVTHTTGGIELQRLSKQASEEQLSQALFGGYYGQHQANIFALPNTRSNFDQDTLKTLCQQLVSQVRCYKCQLGTEAYKSDRTATEFVDFLLQEA